MAAPYRDYPLFWWNFLVVEGRMDSQSLSALCEDVAESFPIEIQKIPCHFDLKSLRSLAADWIADTPRRIPAPGSNALHQKFSEALGKASLPMGRDILELLRLDPLSTLEDLKQRMQSRMRMGLSLKQGLLFDEKSGRVLIPLQFANSPAQTKSTAEVVSKLPNLCARHQGCEQLTLFGPHASTLENEKRILDDVWAISIVGAIGLMILLGFIISTGRWPLIKLVPWLFLSIGITTVITVWVFGKIHGITLGFGPGIVGLSMDYGIHSAFLDPLSKKTWRANLAGLFTTVVVMIILGFSSIPLMRQMMFYATLGLCVNYVLFFIVMRKWPAHFATTHFAVDFWNSGLSKKIWTAVALILLVTSVLIFLKPVELSVQHLNYESQKTVEIRKWFFAVSGTGSPVVALEDPIDPLTSSEHKLRWSRENAQTFDGISGLLPTEAEQTANLKTWRKLFCEQPFRLTAKEKIFFEPFLKNLECSELQLRSLKSSVPSYLKDMEHKGQFIGMFFPRNDEDRNQLREKFPKASTPREIFESFPRILYGELLWMLPLAFLAAWAFLWNHYRHIGWSLLATVPFFTGVGLYALAAPQLSFVSLIGLVMVFGCSLDYGIFILDFILFRSQDPPGVRSALGLCAAATISGFAPLIFAKHPVLNDLGQPLFWGTLGTLIGSLWGIPAVHSLWRRWSAA
jgi:predicted exporter